MTYFFIQYLIPNTAATNHLLGIVDTFRKYGVPYKLVIKSPSPGFAEIPSIKNYEIVRLYSPITKSTGVGFFDHVLTNLEHRKQLLSKRGYKRFLSKLTKDDSVFVYGADAMLEDFIATGCKVYQERTEHPDAFSYLDEEGKRKYLKATTCLTGMFVITTSLRDYFIQNGVAPERIHILNMMVDPSRFEGVVKQPSKERVIAYCGTASNTKDGVDNLIKAFSLVARKHPDVRLRIIGKTPDVKEKNSNMELIQELGIGEKVVFTGQVKAADMPQLLTNAEILALARPNNLQAKHGFSTKLGEYLLTGNPVVVTNTGDIALFLKDKESAFVVEPDNPQVFADALCYALENVEKAKAVGEKGKEVALLNFNNEKESLKVMKHLLDRAYCPESQEVIKKRGG